MLEPETPRYVSRCIPNGVLDVIQHEAGEPNVDLCIGYADYMLYHVTVPLREDAQLGQQAIKFCRQLSPCAIYLRDMQI